MSRREGASADRSLLSRPRGAQAGEHSARGSVYVGAKTRERQRQNGVAEIRSKALLICLNCLAGSCPDDGQPAPMTSRACRLCANDKCGGLRQISTQIILIWTAR